MSRTIIERPLGSINGINRTFHTSGPYRPGSIVVWRNGDLLTRDDDLFGITETASQEIKLTSPPKEGDIIQVGYTLA